MFSYPYGAALVSVNGTDISEFSAKLNSDYEISGPEIELDTWQGRNRSTMLLLGQTYGLLSIKLPIDFWGCCKVDVMEKITAFNAAIKGRFELDLHDGFLYTCAVKEVGAPQWITDEFCTADYEFVGVRHKELVTYVGKTGYILDNPGTAEKTDCRITMTFSVDPVNAYMRLLIYPGTYPLNYFLSYRIDVSGGDYADAGVLVIDGFNKTITYNGGPLPTPMEWTDYPYLVPGANTVDADVGGALGALSIKVEYYPTYI